MLALAIIEVAAEYAWSHSDAARDTGTNSVRHQVAVFNALRACLAAETEGLAAAIENADDDVLPFLLELLGSVYVSPSASSRKVCCVAEACSSTINGKPANGKAAAMRVLADLFDAHPLQVETTVTLQPLSSLTTPALRSGDLHFRGHFVTRAESTEAELREWCGMMREASNETNVSTGPFVESLSDGFRTSPRD